jgi:hypothetical protein
MAGDGDRVALTGKAMDKELFGEDRDDYATTVVDEQDDDYAPERSKGCAALPRPPISGPASPRARRVANDAACRPPQSPRCGPSAVRRRRARRVLKRVLVGVA